MKKLVFWVIVVGLFAVIAIIGNSHIKSVPSVLAKLQPTATPSKKTDLEVSALEVAEMKKDGDLIEILLKNVSYKEIDGLTLLFDDSTTITVDYTISGYGITPNALKEIKIPAEAKGDLIVNSIIIRPFFKIVAVTFTNRTEEGDPKYISEIKDRRHGLKTQLEKFLPDLSKMSNASTRTLPAILQETKRKILTLPEESANESHSFKQGLNDGKEDILKIINEAMNQQDQERTDSQKVQNFLKEKTDKIMERINRL